MLRPVGEPLLQVALLKAAKSRLASYVWRWDDVDGWQVGDAVPYVAAYYRISRQRIHVRHRNGQEVYFGRIVGGKIIQEGSVESVGVVHRRVR